MEEGGGETGGRREGGGGEMRGGREVKQKEGDEGGGWRREAKIEKKIVCAKKAPLSSCSLVFTSHATILESPHGVYD